MAKIMKLNLKNFINLVLSLILFNNINAQDASKLSWQRNVDEGDKLYKIGSYYNALYYYRNALEKINPKEEPKTQKDIVWKVGNCYFLLRDYEKSRYYLKFIRKEAEIFPLANLYYAKSLKYQGQYDSSLIAFNDAITNANGNYENEIRRQSNLEIKGITLAKEKMSDSLMLQISRMSNDINGTSSDFAPKLWGEKLIFSHINTTIENDNYGVQVRNDEAVANIFESEKSTYGFTPRKLIEQAINKIDTHSCNGVFNYNKSKFYFTRCEITKTLGTRCDIYEAKMWNNTFNEIRKVNELNEKTATNTHPFITKINNDTEIMFFVSDRAGSKGGLDIWYSVVNEDGEFETPKNAFGINTIDNETTPFFEPIDNKFYFSSDGYPSLGGLDIFESKFYREKFSPPVNIGFPLNSSLDDYYYYTFNKGTKGFLVSNRPEKGVKRKTFDDDIFYFEWDNQTFEKIKIKGEVLSSKPYPANISLVRIYEYKNNKKGNLPIQTGETDANGAFSFQLSEGKYLINILNNKNTLDSIVQIVANKDYFFTFNANYIKPIFAESTKSNEIVADVSAKIESKSEPVKKEATTIEKIEPEPALSTKSNVENVIKIVSKTDVMELPKQTGTIYRVQLAALNNMSGIKKYYQLSKEANLYYELLPNGLIRVLLGDFTTRKEAEILKEKLKNYALNDAIIAIYTNGIKTK
jgi:tetratricopeptide (TPR) repeat protein/cell division septation protein DedD